MLSSTGCDNIVNMLFLIKKNLRQSADRQSADKDDQPT